MITNKAEAEHALLTALKEGPKTGEMLVYLMKDAGASAPRDSAFGGVFTSLARRGLIRRIGYVKRARTGGPGCLWEAA